MRILVFVGSLVVAYLLWPSETPQGVFGEDPTTVWAAVLPSIVIGTGLAAFLGGEWRFVFLCTALTGGAMVLAGGNISAIYAGAIVALVGCAGVFVTR
jgi:hypothetical protein